MAHLFDYLQWRGDIPFRQVPMTPVDSLLFSALVYIDFSGIVPGDFTEPVTIASAAEAFFALEDHEELVRVRSDLTLLERMAEAPRFRDVRLCYFRSKRIIAEETQFAAMACLLDDDTVFLAFRGTDDSLVGWKEDFNMSFQDTVPAQREAALYLTEFAAESSLPLYLGGHSKGGNLAVYAAAKASQRLQKRILTVYNNDGPGFTDTLMGDPGYLAMVPKIQTYIPESSIIGMLLEHEEPYRIIQSRQVSILQHELYSWEVMAGKFIYAEETSKNARIINAAIKNWVQDMDLEERSLFVDSIYNLLSAGGATTVTELIQPKNVWSFFRALNTNDDSRRLLAGGLVDFIREVAKARNA